MAAKTITFSSTDLGETVNLMLCFMPQTSDLFVKQFPVVWKVQTLLAHGRSSLAATYSDRLGFSSVNMEYGKRVTMGNYIPIELGQQTTLDIENNSRPPVYYFSDPTSTGTNDLVKAVNLTGQPANIGLGFINDVDRPNESMNTTVVFQNMRDRLSVAGPRSTVLRAYIGLDYQEGELIRSDIQGVTPLWEADILDLPSSTTITVTKNRASDTFTATQNNAIAQYSVSAHARTYSPMPEVLTTSVVPTVFVNGSEEREKVYSATLAFAASDMVVQGVKLIAEHLITKGYHVKFTYVEGSADAALEVTLPYNVSCDRAENDMLAAIDNQLSDMSNDRVRIKARSGARMVSSGDSFTYWVDINPASQDWFTNVRYQYPFSPSRTRFSANRPGYAAPHLEIPHTKNRPFSKKSSAVSLNGF